MVQGVLPVTNEPDDQTEKKLPGLPLKTFEAAVKAIAALRDQGKALLFLGKRSSFRVIAEFSDFKDALASQAEGDEPSEEDAHKALAEVGNYAAALGRGGRVDALVDILSNTVHRKDLEGLDENGKEAFRQRVREKIGFTSDGLLTRAMRSREARLATTTAPSIEDLDFELVCERQDGLQAKTVAEPFLRFRLRYSAEERDSVRSVFWAWAFVPPGRGEHLADSFEFDADETDIDLLIARLTRAKERLLRAREQSRENGDG